MSSPTSSDSGPLHKSLALEVPKDVWVRILLELEYKDLKKSMRICKKLQAIVSGEEFDGVLFRAKPAKPQLKEGETLKIHPMLEKTDCVFKDFDSAQILHQGVGESDFKSYYPKDYPSILNEYATSPASSLVILHMFDLKPSQPLSKMKGVKVADVLKWIAKYWKPINLERALSSHCFFEGWDMALAKGQNWTDLISRPFGS